MLRFLLEPDRKGDRLEAMIAMQILLFCLLFPATILWTGCSQNHHREGDSLAALYLLSRTEPSVSQETEDCGDADPPPESGSLADTVVRAPSRNPESDTGDPRKATNGICGGGKDAGSTDVFSLESTGNGATLILEWSGRRITNGSGIDFVVFENPFQVGGSGERVFIEALVVQVGNSPEGPWCGFDPDYRYADEENYSGNPVYWSGFAGKTPVLYNRKTNPLEGEDLFRTDLAGGDAFDLDDLSEKDFEGSDCTTELRNWIRDSYGFTYIRLIAASALTNPDSGEPFPRDPGAGETGGPDIDGVLARYTTNR